MGGMGFIERFKAQCMLSVLINTHLLMAARDAGVERYFYASSACVYAKDKQCTTDLSNGLKEEDAYPAMPEDGYGWEKLFSERMCRHFREDYGTVTRIARYHNIYGPNGTWFGGREKAPAAMCRKVISSVKSGNNKMNIWGDGEQTRSFTYIDDCIEGTLKLMYSDVEEPLNIGSSEMVTINSLAALCEGFASVKLNYTHLLDKPLGVRGRSSNNELVRKLLGWEPRISLATGMRKTYEWISAEMKNANYVEDPED
jgi:nucleoside-diphosphate-sugar epimerase